MITTLNIGDVPVTQRENRESYTDQQVQARVSAASGSAASSDIGTVAAIARLWEFAFAAGKSTVLSPWMLGLIGRGLILCGESVWYNGRDGLQSVSDHDIQGEASSPSRWRYRISVPAPSRTISFKAVKADRILHVRIGSTPQQPWVGKSPLLESKSTRALVEHVEQSLGYEHSGPIGHLLPVPDPEGSSAVAEAISEMKGRTVLTEASELDLSGEGMAGRAPAKPNRIGPAPSAGTVAAREAAERSLLAACGVPVELVQSASGSDAREGWRRFLWSTIAPAAALVSDELQRLGLDPDISFDSLNASDLAGRARAFGILVGNGMPDDEARKISGFTD